MAVVTPTDRPKSVCNRYTCNEVFGGVFVLSRCFLDFSVGVGAFVIGLSQIFSLFFYLSSELLEVHQQAVLFLFIRELKYTGVFLFQIIFEMRIYQLSCKECLCLLSICIITIQNIVAGNCFMPDFVVHFLRL